MKRSSIVLLVVVFVAGCASPSLKTQILNSTLSPAAEQEDLPAGTGGVPDGDTSPWPIGGWDAVTQRLRLPRLKGGAAFEAQVEYTFVVDSTGKVVDVQITRGAGPEIDAAVRQALLDTPFRPALRKGVPMGAKMMHGLRISIPSSDQPER